MSLLRSRLLRSVSLAAACAAPALAQIGDRLDKPGDKQESLVPKERIPAAPALSPAEALKTFKVAPGFRIELVASEPLIGDPVAMTFGPDGRLWVVEMRGYMHDVDGHGEDLKIGRISVLTDTDGDGRMDKGVVFADGLVMPRAIMLVNGGVLVGAPPELLFFRDTDGDGKADQRTVVATDFGLAVIPERPEVSNPERAPNGLLWGRDNFIYGAAYESRYRLKTDGTFERSATFFRGQYGLSQDDAGHLFHNSNSDQLRGDVAPANYLMRNPAFLSARGANVKVADNQTVWSIRVNPGVNRGYQSAIIKPDGHLGAFTAACSPHIYRGDALGADVYGNAFVAEPAANLVKRNIVTEKNGTLTSTHAYAKSEFLASTDERFRPVWITDGPDGALYVADLYRGILQHRISLTTYLRNQIKDRNLENPIGLGRIYRIVREGASPKNAAAPKSTAEWVARLSHPNGWWRDLAQQTLVESRDPAATAPLRALAKESASPLARVAALSTLDGRGETDRATVFPALHHASAPVRVAAIRVSESLLRGPDRAATLAELRTLKDDADPSVQLQLVLTLGEAADPAADRLMADIVRAFPAHPFLADAAVSGLAARELALLEQLTADAAWKETAAPTDRLLGLLAACVFNQGNAAHASRALDALIAGVTPAHQNARLVALAAAIEHGAASPKPSAQFTALLTSTDTRVRTQAMKLADTVLLPADGKPRPAPRPLKGAEKNLYEQGAILFGMNCAACHQADGKGRDGLAPPLAGSDWATGPASRPARVVLHGLTGKIVVKDQTYQLDMPGFGLLKDEQLAAILTYVRRAWGNRAEPITPAQMQAIRAATADRSRAWTAEELLAVP